MRLAALCTFFAAVLSAQSDATFEVASVKPSPQKSQTITPLAVMLGNQLGRPVLDKTGLRGKYDFELKFAPDSKGMALPGPPPSANGAGAGMIGPAENVGDSAPDIVTAVQQQLGLKLVAARAKLEVLVIDKVEKTPTAN